MHLELLVEDISGKRALEILIPKILGTEHSFRVHAYRGIGHVPKNMRDTKHANRRILLENLPKLLKGYGRTFANYPAPRPAVVLVCDLDDKNLFDFLRELNGILAQCNPAPTARFCFAIEEGEAWFLGDMPAIKSAFPHARDEVLGSYVNDSICGTWELLANAVYPGGAAALETRGYQAIGMEKSKWAESICPHMDIDANNSPSFLFFRRTVKEITSN